MATKSRPDTSVDAAIIINELDRRYYLYLIGGAYEKLFYTFDDADEEQSKMERIRLDIEVSQAERKKISEQNCPDTDYLNMLEYLLESRVFRALEYDGNLIALSRPVSQIVPILRSTSPNPDLDKTTIEMISQVEWLKDSIEKFMNSPLASHLLNVSSHDTFEECLKKLGTSLFYWLLPRCIGDKLAADLHPTLRPTLKKIKFFNSVMSGAIACLSVNQSLKLDYRWQLHASAAVSLLPIALLLSIVNQELVGLHKTQRDSLTNETDGLLKRQVLENFSVPGEVLRETFNMEEFVRPHVFESISLPQFDAVKFILGGSEVDYLANIYHQARAYSFYRQLFKTGRIHTRETAIFLTQHNISKQKLMLLNKQDLADSRVQITLLKKLLHTG